jgi:hypothetical protein
MFIPERKRKTERAESGRHTAEAIPVPGSCVLVPSLNLVAVILDYRIAQEIATELVELRAKLRRIGGGEFKLDELAHPGAFKPLEAEAFQRMAHGGALRIEHVFLGSDKDVDFHGPLKRNDDAVNPKTVKGFVSKRGRRNLRRSCLSQGQLIPI